MFSFNSGQEQAKQLAKQTEKELQPRTKMARCCKKCHHPMKGTHGRIVLSPTHDCVPCSLHYYIYFSYVPYISVILAGLDFKVSITPNATLQV